jgi:hypothetical protein
MLKDAMLTVAAYSISLVPRSSAAAGRVTVFTR